MYKLYDFVCGCGYSREELVDVPAMLTSVHCPECNGLMEPSTVGGRAHVFRPFWHPHLGHRPVYISSWAQYRCELQKRKLANELGS